MERFGWHVVSVSSASPQAFAQFVQADNAKMAKVLAMSQVNNG